MAFRTPNTFRPPDHPLLSVTSCPECKMHNISLPAYPGDYFDCEDCGHSWPCTKQQVAEMWQSKASSAYERFVIMEQATPTRFVTDTKTILPLKWEVIDRGQDFVVWQENTVNEVVLARFATLEHAVHLKNVLIGLVQTDTR